VVRTRIGSPYVIAGMQAAAAGRAGRVAGYEANGGFLLGTSVERDGRRLEALPTRDAVLPMLALMCAARERGGSLSALAASLPKRFTASDRIQAFATERSAALLERLAQDQGAAAALLAPECGDIVSVDTTDGLRATFGSGDVVHLRPSGNAPELRCYTESESAQRAGRLCAQCLGRVAAMPDERSISVDGRRPDATVSLALA
jgi:phosphomannomutase